MCASLSRFGASEREREKDRERKRQKIWKKRPFFERQQTSNWRINAQTFFAFGFKQTFCFSHTNTHTKRLTVFWLLATNLHTQTEREKTTWRLLTTQKQTRDKQANRQTHISLLSLSAHEFCCILLSIDRLIIYQSFQVPTTINKSSFACRQKSMQAKRARGEQSEVEGTCKRLIKQWRPSASSAQKTAWAQTTTTTTIVICCSTVFPLSLVFFHHQQPFIVRCRRRRRTFTCNQSACKSYLLSCYCCRHNYCCCSSMVAWGSQLEQLLARLFNNTLSLHTNQPLLSPSSTCSRALII